MPLSYRPTARRAIHVRSRPDCPEIAQNRRARPCGPFDIGCFSIRSCAQLSMGTCRGTNFAMYHMPLASSSAMDRLVLWLGRSPTLGFAISRVAFSAAATRKVDAMFSNAPACAHTALQMEDAVRQLKVGRASGGEREG